MNRWKLSKSWITIWGVTFFLGCLIFFIGFLSSIPSDLSQEIPSTINDETVQVVSAQIAQNTETDLVNEIIGTQQEELELVFGQINEVEKPLELEDFPSPVQGKPLRNVGNYYSEAFKSYIFHAGRDYALSEGTVIRATRGGKVVLSGPDPLLGQRVTLDCGEGWLVTYGGLDNLRVREWEVVEFKGALGQVGLFPGEEGESGQPQLHYEVWHQGQVQRPL